ncbi:hypothetical protein IAU59_004343 [Kwoniella sp. CBS 9459]
MAPPSQDIVPHNEGSQSSSSSSSGSSSAPESASSPTPTIRQVSNPNSIQIPTASQTFADIVKSTPSSSSDQAPTPKAIELKRTSSQQQQQGLGMGRPGPGPGVTGEAATGEYADASSGKDELSVLRFSPTDPTGQSDCDCLTLRPQSGVFNLPSE